MPVEAFHARRRSLPLKDEADDGDTTIVKVQVWKENAQCLLLGRGSFGASFFALVIVRSELSRLVDDFECYCSI